MNNIIAVFGGSFNPPHYAHFLFAEEIINEINDIKKVLFLPVSSKYEKQNLLSNEHRYNMLKLVCDEDDRFDVSNLEHIQERQLNTYETLELLQEKYPGYELIFIIGTDNLKELYWWGNIDLLLAKYKILVIERGEDKFEDIIETQDFLKKYRNSFIRYNQNVRTNLSSTYIRNEIYKNKDFKYLVPHKVYEYIKENNLYRG